MVTAYVQKVAMSVFNGVSDFTASIMMFRNDLDCCIRCLMTSRKGLRAETTTGEHGLERDMVEEDVIVVTAKSCFALPTSCKTKCDRESDDDRN